MGKSPGRWVKTLIFGKKSSRSKNPKQNHEKRDVPVSLDQTTEPETEENLHPDNSQDQVFVSATPELNASQNDSNRTREEEAAAAIGLQAALRGYLARRWFQNLKCIIRLQALIRGHLVRRQAISTLYCMFQIVKFQALARGRKIQSSNIGIQSKRYNRLVVGSIEVNSSSNKFAQKILQSSLTPMPLHFQYDPNEANSVLSWLERWSTSRCWHQHLHPNPKSGDSSIPQKPHTRRSSVTDIASEFDKPIRNLRKVSSNVPVNCNEENPELVLVRVKSNLRKVNSSVLESTNDSIQKMITEPEGLRVTESGTVIIRKNEKEDESVNERKKSRQVVCVSVKQESMENDEPSQIKRSVPCYMASTISAKAKQRGQDGPGNINTLTRTHSLPSLTNDSISVSPLAKTTGKVKNDRSLQLSGDVIVRVK